MPTGSFGIRLPNLNVHGFGEDRLSEFVSSGLCGNEAGIILVVDDTSYTSNHAMLPVLFVSVSKTAKDFQDK
jgi:hypothetical protein